MSLILDMKIIILIFMTLVTTISIFFMKRSSGFKNQFLTFNQTLYFYYCQFLAQILAMGYIRAWAGRPWELW
jgi:hypothetical protein